MRRDVRASEGRSQLQMWNVIRGPMGREGFSAKDLSVFATTEDAKVTLNSASTYLRHLAKAGYLQCVSGPNKGAAKPATWRLKPGMNTGPRPPMIFKLDLIFDQNRAKIVGRCEALEVLP